MLARESPVPDPDHAGAIKVWVRFVPRAGWPPFDTEGLWAMPVGSDTARIRNVPFLANGIAEDDVIRYVTATDGARWAKERVEASGNCAIRVLPRRGGPLGPDPQRVYERFAPFGLGGETYSDEFPLVALHIPFDAPFKEIKALLAHGENERWWGYEPSCVTDAWTRA